MKAIKSVSEQFQQVMNDLNIVDYVNIKEVKLKNNDKIEAKTDIRPPFTIGHNDWDFRNKFCINVKSDNNQEELEAKIIKRFSKYEKLKTVFKEMKELGTQYGLLMETYLPIIKNDLEKSLTIETLQISSWINEDDIFHDRCGFTFYIHPKNTAPGDGEMFLITPNKDITIFWNNYCGHVAEISNVFKRITFKGDEIEKLKQQIEGIHKVQDFITSYKPCKELEEALVLHKKGHDIYMKLSQMM